MKNLLSIIYLFLPILLLLLLEHSPLLAQNNNMGIGTTTPDASAILDVKSTSKGLLIPRLTNGQEGGLSGPSGLLIYNTSQNKLKYYNGGWKSVGLWDLNGSAARYTGGNVETTGGFFINNTSPTIYLQDTDHSSGMIHQNSNLMYFLNGTGANSTTWAANGTYWPLTLNMTNDVATFGGEAHFMEGNVGIGFDNPLEKLHVNGNLRVDNGQYQSWGPIDLHPDVDNSGDDIIRFLNNAGSEIMRVHDNGSVGIGQSSPSEYNKLEVLAPNGAFRAGVFYNNNSSGEAALYVRNGGGGNGIWLQEGIAAKPGGGPWSATSDERLKTDIKDYQDGLQMIRAIRPVSYRYNGIKDLPTEPTFIGIIAQEVEKIAPYMVRMDGEYLQVDPNAFTYMLINSVKELDETVQKQKEIIEAQNAKLAAIEKALEKAGIPLD